ncbi:MAG: Zn-ribbon domain-containing OB-fold protein [Pseudomonadota bacterium]
MNEPAMGAERAFRDALAEGRWLIQRSKSTGKHVYPPRELAPGTGETDLEWVEPSGLGTVYSFTVVNRREDRGGPYNVVVVELDEGPRLMSAIPALAPEAVKIGLRVKARVEGEGPAARVVFDPAEGA